jgi:hypothetical protein
MLDLMFRDQSEEIKAKVLNRKTTKKCCAPSATQSPRRCRPSSPPESSDSDETAEDLNVFTRLNLSISAQDQAPCFFFGHYVLEDSPVSNGYFDHLPKLYSNSPAGSALSNIVISLGMAGLSIDKAIPQIMTPARSKYAEALRTVGDALNDPREAKADQTLMTVMLLALYEVHLSRTSGQRIKLTPSTVHFRPYSPVNAMLDKSSKWRSSVVEYTWYSTIKEQNWSPIVYCSTFPSCKPLWTTRR